MDKLRKCGQLWIKFDKNNEPEYGFKVQGRKIEEFLNLSDREVNKVILPEICEEQAYSPEDLKFIIEHANDENRFLRSTNRGILKSYLRGQTVISSNCFKGCLKKTEQPVEIIMPFNHSLMIDHGAFDDDIKPKFILKNGMQIFIIKRMFDTYFDYEREFWALIGRNEIKDVSLSESREDIDVSKFEPNRYYNIDVDY